MPLFNVPGNSRQGEDLHVLSRGALTGDVLGFLFQLSDNYAVPPTVCGCDIYLVHSHLVNRTWSVRTTKSIANVKIKLKEQVFLFFPGDLRPRCVLDLQSAPAAGVAGPCELFLSATQPACWDQPQEDAHKVEGDGWQVQKCILAVSLKAIHKLDTSYFHLTVNATLSLISQTSRCEVKSLNTELFFDDTRSVL